LSDQLDSVGGWSWRQSDKPWSCSYVEFLSECLVDDVDDRVLKTLLGKVAKRRQSAHQQNCICSEPITAYSS